MAEIMKAHLAQCSVSCFQLDYLRIRTRNPMRFIFPAGYYPMASVARREPVVRTQVHGRGYRTRWACVHATLATLLIVLSGMPAANAAALPDLARAKVPAEFVEKLEQVTGPQDLIVEFEYAAIRTRINEKRIAAGLRHESRELLAEKKQGYDVVKARAFKDVVTGGARILRVYNHLPMAFMHVPNRRALERLLSHPDVAVVYENRQVVPTFKSKGPWSN